MQQSRTMQGCYANWTVTLSTEPAEEGEEAIDVPAHVMASIADCFHLAVNCYELGRDLDRLGSRLR